MRQASSLAAGPAVYDWQVSLFSKESSKPRSKSVITLHHFIKNHSTTYSLTSRLWPHDGFLQINDQENNRLVGLSIEFMRKE
ncbi:hypothetical protein FA10DRAFT_57171 [Acaromyces ingoldii]|uniref:Uncharacterized protein n=1 Tax=Acaromyces ingoldii TaxID=215250 RepID=A0A316YFF1_9BASI|nr:hypothetical protein FA10DRAFT_57171 [Acaromyces ingoldii]PWN86465.1 hypothetical protein FA10DRAFT_57171 [Acaromyces ingoldii]